MFEVDVTSQIWSSIITVVTLNQSNLYRFSFEIYGIHILAGRRLPPDKVPGPSIALSQILDFLRRFSARCLRLSLEKKVLEFSKTVAKRDDNERWWRYKKIQEDEDKMMKTRWWRKNDEDKMASNLNLIKARLLIILRTSSRKQVISKHK